MADRMLCEVQETGRASATHGGGKKGGLHPVPGQSGARSPQMQGLLICLATQTTGGGRCPTGVEEMVPQEIVARKELGKEAGICLLYTSPSPRDKRQSRMPSSA